MDFTQDDYTIEISDDAIVVIRKDGGEKFIFPFHWSAKGRAFTYASIDKPTPTRETWNGKGWTSERMDLATFASWMPRLENLSE